MSTSKCPLKAAALLLAMGIGTLHLSAQGTYRSDYHEAFAEAYQRYPALPPGLLEATAHTRTRIRHVQPDREEASCAGLPGYWGPMALVDDGRGWFRNSLAEVARWSGVGQEVLRRSPGEQILAYAKALHRLSPPGLGGGGQAPDPLAWDGLLLQLCELPLGADEGSRFVLDTYLYGIFSSLNDTTFQRQFKTPPYQLDLEAYFDEGRYQRLTAPEVRLSGPCTDYPGALWTAAHSSNYNSRSGTLVSAVTVHTMQGYYAGSISWFQNPASNVSAHYCLRSSDGQITQMVCEADRAWHVGSENSYTVGLEHEGFVSDASWYTPVMYAASADLTRDIADDYGINPLRTYFKEGSSGLLTLGGCTRIKGHQHYPFQSHTDPGLHWNWAHYYRLINEPVSPLIYTSASGTVHDPGGASGSYGDDQRVVYRIQPPGAGSIALSFSHFNLENNWDYLLVYDGPDVFSPLLGMYTGTSLPPVLNSSAGSLTLEFRSDCATVASGFSASWTSTGTMVCATPANTFTSPIGWTSATLNWDPVSGATQYEIAGRRAGSSAWRYLLSAYTPRWLGIFQAGRTYEWRVRAECPGLGWSGWSSINSFTTNSPREGEETGLADAGGLEVWPVPMQDELYVALPREGRIQLWDGLGRLVFEQPVAGTARVPVASLSPGWYLLRAEQDGVWHQRVLPKP